MWIDRSLSVQKITRLLHSNAAKRRSLSFDTNEKFLRLSVRREGVTPDKF